MTDGKGVHGRRRMRREPESNLLLQHRCQRRKMKSTCLADQSHVRHMFPSMLEVRVFV